MAKKRKSGGGASGFKNGAASIITVVVLIAVVIGWARVNNITDISSGYNYFKAWSDKTWSCGVSELDWTCGTPGGSNSGGSGGTNPDSNNSNGGNANTDNNAPKPEPANPNTPQLPRNELEASLNSVTIAEPQDVAYSRSEWKHWTGSPCNTREQVLKNQGTNVASDPSSCKITGGSWLDKYSGETFTDAGKLDIDHIVPLSYAAKNGGQNLSSDQKLAFANDIEGLYISDAGENRSKGDKGPGEYLPPNDSFKCEYVGSFIHMVKKYNLTMPQKDVTAARSVILNNC